MVPLPCRAGVHLCVFTRNPRCGFDGSCVKSLDKFGVISRVSYVVLPGHEHGTSAHTRVFFHQRLVACSVKLLCVFHTCVRLTQTELLQITFSKIRVQLFVARKREYGRFLLLARFLSVALLNLALGVSLFPTSLTPPPTSTPGLWLLSSPLKNWICAGGASPPRSSQRAPGAWCPRGACRTRGMVRATSCGATPGPSASKADVLTTRLWSLR